MGIKNMAVTGAMAIGMGVAGVAVAPTASASDCTVPASVSQYFCNEFSVPQVQGDPPPTVKQWVFCGFGFLGGPLSGALTCLVDFAWQD